MSIIMETSPLSLKLRAVAFSLIVFISFLWTVLLCIMSFMRWEVLDQPQRSFLIVMLFGHVITVITLLVLLLVEFRPWLDSARFLLLLIIHVGTSSAFAFWRNQFRCLNDAPDQEGVCELLSLYILLASWVIPVLLVLYLSGLACMLYRRHARTATPDTEKRSAVMAQHPIITRSVLTDSPISLTYPTRVYYTNAHAIGNPLTADRSRPPYDPEGNARTTMTTSKRLSKPVHLS